MRRPFTQGISRLGGVVVGSLLLGTAATGAVWFKQQQARELDVERRMTLEQLSRAQGLYFDTHQRYASMEELLAANLMSSLPRDPETGEPLPMYRTEAHDEWCSWARLGASHGVFLTATALTTRLVTHQPTNFQSCRAR